MRSIRRVAWRQGTKKEEYRYVDEYDEGNDNYIDTVQVYRLVCSVQALIMVSMVMMVTVISYAMIHKLFNKLGGVTNDKK